MSSSVSGESVCGPTNESLALPPDDPHRNRFPCCVVWAPLPCLTWLFPIVGHMGIADSQGRIHDFAGPYAVVVDSFMVGKARRIWRAYRSVGDGNIDLASWDDSLTLADREYQSKMHNICCQNCHHHTAQALNNYAGTTHSQFSILWNVIVRGEWVDTSSMLCSVLPFVCIVSVILLVVLFT
eukprot:Rhum_TRINITY_DN12883_c0_g5::Rhum_TRINITY_DN12883_c0_g5_i1::g.55023::m.55023/K20726/TMEM222; transmembrane protein 222